MAQFIIKSTSTIEDSKIITPTTLGEGREWLNDLEQTEAYQAMGLETPFVQQSSETLARGVMRGLYFQRKDSYGRLLAVTSGRVLAVVVDLRPECESFGAANSVELSAENESMLYVPPYFACGYMTLEPKTTLLCNHEAEYDTKEESGIIFDDEIISINWQFERYEIDERRLNISQRDKKFPNFRSYNPNSLWINRPKKSKYALSRERKRVIV